MPAPFEIKRYFFMKTNLNDLVPEIIIRVLSFVAVIVMIFMFYFVFSKASPVLLSSGLKLFTQTGFDKQISDAFNAPKGTPMVTFGMLGLIGGTFFSTLIAVIIASMLGIGSTIAICEFMPAKLGIFFKTVVRMLASIPSVVFGLIGTIAVVPLVEKAFVTVDLQIEYLQYFQMTGRNLLSSVIVLSFMIVPTIISLSMDAVNSVPASYREVGFAFGMSHFRVIWKIVIPSALSGIMAGIILGAGRGIGEAIAVSMVCGGVGYLPDFTKGFVGLLTPVLPLSAAIINKSEAMSVPAVESALFTCGAILLVFSAVLSVSAKMVEKQIRRVKGHDE